MTTNPFIFTTSFAILLTTLWLIQYGQSRALEQSLYLNAFARDKWHYITRFGCGIGRCNFQFRFKTSQPIQSLYPDKKSVPFSLLIFATDHSWPNAMNYEDLKTRAEQAYMRRVIELPTDGTDSFSHQYTLTNSVKSRVYYFFLAALDPILDGKQFEKKLHLKIEFTIKNVDGSHISQEEYGMQFPHLAMAVLYAIFFWLNISRILSYYRKEQEIDYPFIFLTSACLIEFLALGLEWLHLVLQEIYGYPLFVTNLLSGMFSMLAQLLITYLLLLIATGWSITYYQPGDLELFAPLGGLLALYHFIFAIFGQNQEDNPYSSHDYENYPGMILLISKVCFFAVFIWLLWQMYKKADLKLRQFVLIFAALGGVYLLTLPIAVYIVSHFVDIHSRHRVIVVSNMMLQSITLLALTALLISRRSPYHNLSFKGRSNLPNLGSKLD